MNLLNMHHTADIFFFLTRYVRKTVRLIIVARNNIVWSGYCLCYSKTFSLVPDSTECTKKIFIEECSTLFVPLKIK